MENKYVARDAKNKQNPRISKNGAMQAQSTKYNVYFGQFVHKHDENAHKMARFFIDEFVTRNITGCEKFVIFLEFKTSSLSSSSFFLFWSVIVL